MTDMHTEEQNGERSPPPDFLFLCKLTSWLQSKRPFVPCLYSGRTHSIAGRLNDRAGWTNWCPAAIQTRDKRPLGSKPACQFSVRERGPDYSERERERERDGQLSPSCASGYIFVTYILVLKHWKWSNNILLYHNILKCSSHFCLLVLTTNC